MLARTLALITLLYATFTSSFPHYPRRTIAGVRVLDTPLIRSAQAYARSHSDDTVYRHIMRSWLFGTLLLDHNATLAAAVDPEVHAVAVILHDLGWDRAPNSTVVSHDRRFEVDGAIAAREFIRSHKGGRGWEERRVQLVWDAIALHTDSSISPYKEAEVATVGSSINMDFFGPNFGITQDQYAAVVKEFPNDGLVATVADTFAWLCRTKPDTTYDTFMQPYGERFVQGYNPVGHRSIDKVLGP
ncbi:hypothetical protein BR93DRAFT_906075 [Coniochaeta sp. PMI_546]|nr:hypothetical protein BR93DRAFT_906075 [Coniochaeta sp. PMI_546]